jgi:hypothetical protein
MFSHKIRIKVKRFRLNFAGHWLTGQRAKSSPRAAFTNTNAKIPKNGIPDRKRYNGRG